MKFNYQARTKEGEVRIGAIEAPSQEVAAQLLQKYGLYATVLETSQSQPFYTKKIAFFGRVSTKDIVLFTRQISIMFNSRISLVESLRVIAQQTDNSGFQEKIIRMSEEIEAGTALSAALTRYPKIFSSFFVAMVQAGETSGKLSEALNYLAEYLEREYRLKKKLQVAMIYPALIIVVAVSVLLLMTIFVVPKLSKVLAETEQELPLLTKMTISFSAFLRQWVWLLFLLLAGLITFSFRWAGTKNGKAFFDKFFLKLPLVGPLLKMIYLSRFAENLSTLILGGLPIVQALQITSRIVGNVVYQGIILRAIENVRKGEAISQSLGQFPMFFPPMFVQMTLIGEKTGTLDKTLMNLVNFYQQEISRSTEGLLAILEPLLIVFLGLTVGGLMASILLPMYRVAGN